MGFFQGRVELRILFLLAILCFAGVARADPITVEIGSVDQTTVTGRVWFGSHEGALNLSESVAGGSAVVLHVIASQGTRVTFTRHEDPLVSEDRGRNEELVGPLGPGTLTLDLCEANCDIFLFGADEQPSQLVVSGIAETALEFTTDAISYCGYPRWCRSEDFVRSQVPGGFHIGDSPAALTRLADGHLTASGKFDLLIRNGAATFEGVNGSQRLEALRVTRTSAGGFVEDIESTFIHLKVDLSGIELEQGAPFHVRSASTTLSVVGRVELETATGVVSYQGKRVPFNAEHVAIDGDTIVGLTVAPSLGGLGVVGQGVSGDIGGDARWIQVGATLYRETPLASAGPAVVTAVAGGLLAALALALRLLWLPLYSRIAGHRVLVNANREAIYALLGDGRPRSIAEISRDLGIGRALGIHHLRMLEAHGLVTSQRLGRVRAFVTRAASPHENTLARAAPLFDQTRRSVAAAVVRGGGVTQKELVASTGLSQRLVSYHLSKLEASMLIRTEGRLPYRYLPTPDLSHAFPDNSAASPA